MEDLIDAFQNPMDNWHVIRMDGGYEIVLDEREVKEVNESILKRYSIPSDRSLP